MVMYYVSQVTIISNLVEQAYTDKDKFSAAENGFFIAAALTEYDMETEPIEDPSYGELKFIHNRWGNVDGELFWE